MRFGFVLPGGSAQEQLDQAVAAEAAGWDGVFVWEGAYGVDAWSVLAAMATRTSRIRLGTMLTPLPWRRPWKVASQAFTLASLSDGRAILAVGLGAVDPVLGMTGEETDRRARAAMLDEGIDLVKALWAGERVFDGSRYRIDLSARTDLRDIQPVHVPIWVVGAWPREKSMARVLRCDGVLPTRIGKHGARLADIADIPPMLEWLRARGKDLAGFDVVVEGETPIDAGAAGEVVRPWREAGATWWLETRWDAVTGRDRARAVGERLEAGPPRA